MIILRKLWALCALVLASLAVPAQADVAVTFYSHDFGENFPHAFFTVKGSLDSGQAVNGAYGFTAQNVSPGILLGSVTGIVKAPSTKYIGQSNPHFTIRASDAEYARLMAVVAKWKAIPQKSYNLGKRNCVHFIADAVRAVGLKTNASTKFYKKPKSFMLEVMKLNPGL